MPYSLRKLGKKKWGVYHKTKKKIVGVSTSRSKAVSHMRARYAHSKDM